MKVPSNRPGKEKKKKGSGAKEEKRGEEQRIEVEVKPNDQTQEMKL